MKAVGIQGIEFKEAGGGHRPRKRKVIFVIRNLGKGGAEKVLTELLEHLDRNQIEPACIFYDSRHSFEIPRDVKTHSLEIPGTRRPFQKFLRSILRIFRIRRILEIEKPDVVCSFLDGVNLTVILASLLSGSDSKVVLSERNTPSFHGSSRSWGLDNYLIRKLYPMADKVIAVSEGVKNDLVNSFHLSPGKIEVIYNPVDPDKIERLAKEEIVEHPWFMENVPIVINVGSLSEKKGQDYLLKSFKLVKSECSARLIILGEGDKAAELKRLALELGIQDSVFFLGYQANPYKFIAKSSVFVLSSLWEGLPNVILEAMACGVPVVSTDCPSGPSEIIENRKTGILVPVADEFSLAEAIKSVLENRSLRKELSLAAAKSLAKYSIRDVTIRYQRVLTEDA